MLSAVDLELGTIDNFCFILFVSFLQCSCRYFLRNKNVSYSCVITFIIKKKQ